MEYTNFFIQKYLIYVIRSLHKNQRVAQFSRLFIEWLFYKQIIVFA